VLNRLIESQRCKCHKKKRTREFQLRSFFVIHTSRSQKHIILKNFKLLQNDNKTGRIFSQPPLIKRDKNIGNFLVQKGVLKSDNLPGTFKCPRKPSHSQCRQNNRAQERRRRQATVSANTYEDGEKMTKTHPNQSPDISVS